MRLHLATLSAWRESRRWSHKLIVEATPHRPDCHEEPPPTLALVSASASASSFTGEMRPACTAAHGGRRCSTGLSVCTPVACVFSPLVCGAMSDAQRFSHATATFRFFPFIFLPSPRDVPVCRHASAPRPHRPITRCVCVSSAMQNAHTCCSVLLCSRNALLKRNVHLRVSTGQRFRCFLVVAAALCFFSFPFLSFSAAP